MRWGRRANKFGNKLTVADGEKFHSKGEAKRYGELKLLELSGRISELKRQVRYPLKVEGILIGTYIADFVYQEGDREIVEDFKGGYKLPNDYRMKRKLMQAIYGIEIRETGRR